MSIMIPKLTVEELWRALLEGKFSKATSSEQEGFAGCEGECWLWDSKYGVVCADFCVSHIVFQVFEDDHCWAFNQVHGSFELIC